MTQDRHSIEHDGGKPRVSVTFNVGSGWLQNVVAEAERTIAKSVVLSAGVFLEFTGAAEAERQTRNELMIYSGLALALIVMILFVSFHWRANGYLVLANLPFSLIGSVFAIAVTGIGISLGTVVGLVSAMPSCNSRTTNTWSRSRDTLGAWISSCAEPASASCRF